MRLFQSFAFSFLIFSSHVELTFPFEKISITFTFVCSVCSIANSPYGEQYASYSKDIPIIRKSISKQSNDKTIRILLKIILKIKLYVCNRKFSFNIFGKFIEYLFAPYEPCVQTHYILSQIFKQRELIKYNNLHPLLDNKINYLTNWTTQEQRHRNEHPRKIFRLKQIQNQPPKNLDNEHRDNGFTVTHTLRHRQVPSAGRLQAIEMTMATVSESKNLDRERGHSLDPSSGVGVDESADRNRLHFPTFRVRFLNDGKKDGFFSCIRSVDVRDDWWTFAVVLATCVYVNVFIFRCFLRIELWVIFVKASGVLRTLNCFLCVCSNRVVGS